MDLIKCKCGCGEVIPIINKLGHKARFKHGHNSRGRHPSQEVIEKRRQSIIGEKHPQWCGGRRIIGGYWHIYLPKHRFANVAHYVPEHRHIYEESRECCLLSWADVHHKDKCQLNNVWYNLQALIHTKHSILSNRIYPLNHKCVICKSEKTTRRKNGTPQWTYGMCNRCYRMKRITAVSL